MKLLVTIAFSLLCLNGWPQMVKQVNVDSLEKKLQVTRSYPVKLELLGRIIKYYRNIDLKKAMAYANTGLAYAEQMHSDSDICTFDNYIGQIDINGGNLTAGIAQCNKAFLLEKKINYTKATPISLSNIGVANEMLGNYTQSLDNYFDALKYAEANKNNEQLTLCYVNICSVYFNQTDFSKCIYYAKKSLQQGKYVKNYVYAAKALEMIGSSYLQRDSIHQAHFYYNQALKIYTDNKSDLGIATICYALSTTFPGKPQEALAYGLKAQAIWDKIGPQNLYAISNIGNIGITYSDMARDKSANASQRKLYFGKATDYLNRAILIARQADSKQNVMQLSDSLAKVNAEMGNYNAAYANLMVRNKLNDSIYSQDNKNKIASIEGRHEIELRDKQLKINKLEITNQHKMEWFLFGGILALVIITVLIYYQNYQRKKTNSTLVKLNQELDEANKVKTRFFNILNHDLRGPVSNYVHFLQLQREPGLLSDKQREDYAEESIQLAEKLLNNMEDLLLWSKGQMENFKPAKNKLMISELFEYVLSTASSTENITLTFEQPEGMQLYTDEHYLKTILYNLTNNAIKALGNVSCGSIHWKAWREGENAYLSIRDNGPGAGKESFRALYDETAPIGIKHGLGLHIVRDLAKAIGCKVSVDAQSGTGVEIKLNLVNRLIV